MLMLMLMKLLLFHEIHFVSGQAVLPQNRYQDGAFNNNQSSVSSVACRDDEEYSLLEAGGSHGFSDEDVV